jgi:glycosyltransferase involved in cell wall biosynthesis
MPLLLRECRRDDIALRVGVFVPTDFESLLFGGTLAYVQEFLSGLAGGSTVDALLFGLTAEPHRIHQIHERKVGGRPFRFIPLGAFSPPSVVPVRFVFAKALISSRTLIRSSQCNAHYVHNAEGALCLRMVCSDVPIVMHCHGTENTIRRSQHWFARLPAVRMLYESCITRPALHRADGIIVTADAVQYEAFRSRHGIPHSREIMRAPSMVDMGTFKPSEPDLRLLEERLKIVTVGRLQRSKGVSLVIAAAAELKRDGYNVELRVIGQGPYMARLKEIALAEGLGDSVVFTGFLPRSEIAKELRCSHVYASGSEQEGFSVALLEALASGTPAVVTDVGGVREVIAEGITGFVLRGRSVSEMAIAIKAARLGFEDMSRAARAATLPYCRDRIASGIARLIKDVSRSDAGATLRAM